jgi:GTP-binding protein Era
MRVGQVALIGKPNVGKSTLLNRIVGQKVSIVSNKPQTTRRRVRGIAHGPDYEIVFLDTPGVHDPHTRLGRAMVDAARSALTGIQLVVYVADGSHHPGELDRQIAQMIQLGAPGIPVLLCLNKMDLLKAEDVERNVGAYTRLFGTEDFMLTTATSGDNVDKLVRMIVERLPEGEPQYDPDDFTDQSSRFLSAELVREKILHATRQEVPHACAVRIDGWEEREGMTRILASILVERSSQRAIVIGKGGAMLKRIGTQAREEIEGLLGTKVFLELHVTVEENWRMSERLLHELEYEV